MTVLLTWYDTGVIQTDTLDHGSKSNGETTTVREISITHDGANEITATKLYARQFSGTYSGSATAAADFAEVIGNFG